MAVFVASVSGFADNPANESNALKLRYPMAVTEILILTESPFSNRDYDRFGVELLSQRFRVTIIDCTPWVNPDFWERYSAIAYACPGYTTADDFHSIRRSLDRTKDALVIDYLGDSAKSKRIRRELKKRDIPRVVFFHGLLPVGPERLPARLRRMVKRVVIREPAPDVALMSGLAGLADSRVSRAKHTIWAHSLDYDIYLRERRTSGPSISRYAVFLDEDMIYHSDYEHSGTTSPTTAEVYYPAMKHFFDRIERATGMPVQIAMHPRSSFERQQELWAGRDTVQGMTSQLVRDASLVLCHLSTSLAFPVLWRKPVIFLTTSDIDRSAMGKGIALRSTLLQAPLVNVDIEPGERAARDPIPAVNEDAYAKYAANYIKRPGVPELPVWHLFSDYVQGRL